MPLSKTMPVKSKTIGGANKKDKAAFHEVANKTAPVGHNQSQQADEEEDFYKEPVKRFIKPDNQLVLSEDKLDEEITRVLTANDPNVANNTVKYNYKEKVYKQDPEGPMDHLAFHFQMNGSSLFKDTEEATTQVQFEEELHHKAEKLKRDLHQEASDIGEDSIDINLIKSGKSQFNYSERASQTFNMGMKSRGVETEPPAVIKYTSTVSQWDIYDTYMNEYKLQLQEEDHLKTDKKKSMNIDDVIDTKKIKIIDLVHTPKMSKSLKILERMVNQNAEDEIFQDYKYWEDAGDQFRQGYGNLLPLWRFSTERCKRKHVTTLKWNPLYPDMFVVGYGSYDFMHQGSGVICCYSLKNTSHPEYLYITDAGVMCVDFHPQYSSLLAVGCYDGNVLVYDVRLLTKKPLYASNIKSGKHHDPVWEIKWQNEELGKELNFLSISSDGQISLWTMSKNELKMELIMPLKLSRGSTTTTTGTTSTSMALTTIGGNNNSGASTAAAATVHQDTSAESDDLNLSGLASGCCFDFSNYQENIFLVGTEEGKIHKCSKAYSGQYLETYLGHTMAIYGLQWNSYHPNVFISCSADWNVKIWDDRSPAALISFDLGSSVGDIAWAPYSSTTFAAITSDGKVYVYDMSQNKYDPLCEQKVVKRAKNTRVVFNTVEPILLVGDDRGGVVSLKLSPNLRKTSINEISGETTAATTASAVPTPAGAAPGTTAEVEKIDPLELEIQKLEKILDAARI